MIHKRGDIVDVGKSGLWEVDAVGVRYLALRNNVGRMVVMTNTELDSVGETVIL